jgi:hypothetical protein
VSIRKPSLRKRPLQKSVKRQKPSAEPINSPRHFLAVIPENAIAFVRYLVQNRAQLQRLGEIFLRSQTSLLRFWDDEFVGARAFMISQRAFHHVSI